MSHDELVKVLLNNIDRLEDRISHLGDKLDNVLDKLEEKMDNVEKVQVERIYKLEGEVKGIRSIFKYLGSAILAVAGSIIYIVYELLTGK